MRTPFLSPEIYASRVPNRDVGENEGVNLTPIGPYNATSFAKEGKPDSIQARISPTSVSVDLMVNGVFVCVSIDMCAAQEQWRREEKEASEKETQEMLADIAKIPEIKITFMK